MVKSWPKPKLVKDILVFLSFANFYIRFIRNLSRNTATPSSILQIPNKTGGNKTQTSQVYQDRKNQDIPNIVDNSSSSASIGGDMEYLSIVEKLAKKPNLAKLKNSDLTKSK